MHGKQKSKTSALVDFIPIIKWLPKYSLKKDLMNDVIGGLTVGIINVPQGMAYASLAGLEPVYGLYTSLFPGLIYMLFGSSKHVAIGVFAVVSLMSGSCNLRVTDEIIYGRNSTGSVDEAEVRLSVVKSLGLLVGIVQIALGIFRAHHLIAFLSDQIIHGFTTGAAIHVFTAQLNKILGVSLPRYNGFGKLFFTYRDLAIQIINNDVNLYTIIISLFAISILWLLKYIITPRFCSKTKIPIPYDLFVVIIGTISSKVFSINDKFNVKIIGEIPTGLPSASVPDITLFPYFISDAVAIAIVAIVVTISMGKLIAKKQNYELDIKQEFYALGITESVSSLFPVWPSSTALARTLINENAGTKTQLSAIFSAMVLILVLFFIGPFLSYLPVCLLSCIVIVALRGMFLQLKNIKILWKKSKVDWAIFTVTFFATVLYDVVPGLFIGTVTGILISVFRIKSASPFVVNVTEGSEDDNNRNTITVLYPSSLFYFNCDQFEKGIMEIVHNHFYEDHMIEESIRMLDDKKGTKLIVLDMKANVSSDLSGINCLLKIQGELRNRNITFKVKNPNKKIIKLMEDNNALEDLLLYPMEDDN